MSVLSRKNWGTRGMMYVATRKLQASTFGFPYSKHRSDRIIKKLIKRAMPHIMEKLKQPIVWDETLWRTIPKTDGLLFTYKGLA